MEISKEFAEFLAWVIFSGFVLCALGFLLGKWISKEDPNPLGFDDPEYAVMHDRVNEGLPPND